MIKSDYLTEENLGLVLEKLFPKCTIERQKLMYGRKIDFAIDVEDDHKIK